MKTSTRKPSAAESARMDAIKSAGRCLCCDIEGLEKHCGPVEIHHLIAGNRRRGHLFSIGLGSWHHRGVQIDGWIRHSMRVQFGPSLADGSKPFRERYGEDDELLELQNASLGDPVGLVA